MADNTQLAKKEDFSTSLMVKLDSVADALPSDFNKQRFVLNSISLLNDNPKLAEFGKAQILGGLVKGAILGLDFYNKEAHLVPYGKALSFQPDYRGAKKLVKKYSIRKVKDIYAELVREGDDFKYYIKENKKYVDFIPNSFSNGKVIGAFAVISFEDGDILVDRMSIDELEATRKHSKMGNVGAWKDFTGEMYKKTVIHRICKHIDMDFENANQKALFDEDCAIETNSEIIVNREIQENANSVEFDDENIIDV